MLTREFQFQEGTSDKFWRITLDGRTTTVRFGRRGTDGQTQTKELSSEDEARRSFEKLIAEKVKKGYVERTSADTVADAKVAPAAPSSTPPPLVAPAPAAVVTPAAPPVVSCVAEARIDLTHADWCIATWRRMPAPKPAEASPFDREACGAKLRRLPFTISGWLPDWSAVDVPEVMTREEARYWYAAMTRLRRGIDIGPLVEQLSKEPLDADVTVETVRAMYGTGHSRLLTDRIVLVLRHLLPTSTIIDLLLDETLHGRKYEFNHAFIDGFRLHMRPGLSDVDADAMRARLRPHLHQQNWPTDLYEVPSLFLVAAMLGMADELRPVVESWPDDRYLNSDWNDNYHQPQMVIFGLGDAHLVEQHVRRLKLRTRRPRHILGWLAHTETHALDVIRDSILSVTNKETAETLVDTLALAHAPEVAGPMLELYLKSKAHKAARRWLDENTAHAVVGLATVASGRGALADAAIEQLRALKKKGWAESIAGAVQQLPPDARDRVRQEVVDHEDVVVDPFDATNTPEWLSKACDFPLPKKLPAWVTPADLPPIVVNGRRLSDEQVLRVLVALAASPEGEHALLAGLREHSDPASAETFAWKLFERWLTEGAPSKEKWAMTAVGTLGGDASVLKLTPMIRAWPGESQHARAVVGLEVLRRIGTDTALMQLNGIAQKLKFQALKTKARELMEEIAKDKRLTRAELEDRIVPDCELDERGHRIFDFGPRQFQFVLGPEMKPMVRDGDGKLRDNLPSSGAKDDAAMAQAATDEWKLMKKQIRDVAKIQAERLEQAMVTGRRWTAEAFATLIVRHPLMTHLARLLLWGAYGSTGLRSPFRITEDQQYASIKDESFGLPPGDMVGVVHPLHLEDGDRAAWAQVFADYEIIAPFPQLGRTVHRLEKGEEERTSLDRFNGNQLPAPTLVFALEKMGWVRGTAMDAGCFDEHSRQFPAANVTAVLTYDGNVGMGYISPDERLAVTGCHFVSGMREPSGYSRRSKGIELGRVDPVVLSETLHDLGALVEKAR
jgi:predicted DNA-binding WGR domain protein